ncbi:MAG: choice-of-anchor Q domain-containing protein [Bacteroidales bacterium]
MKINCLLLLLFLVLFGIKVQAQPVTYTDNFTTSVSADWTVVNGTWSVSSGVLQSNTTGADPKKLLLTKTGYNLSSATAQQIVARVRVDSWAAGGEDRAGICLMSTTAPDGAHRGYSFLLRPGNKINILSDKLAWATEVSFTWTTGTWYWMKLKIESGYLKGKIWKDGDSEPVDWTISQMLGSGSWTLSTGYPGVVGSAVTGTGVSYDDVTVSTPTAFIPYIENFNSSTICNEWTVKNGTWSVSSGVGQESSTGTTGDPKKLQLTKTGYDIANTNPQMVVAKVRVDTWQDGDYARAGVSLLNNSSGQGYCLMFHNNHSTLQFLNDGIAWSSATTFNWTNSTWYWFKIQYEDNTLKGKVWADGSSEPAAWTITQTGWTARTTGQAALVSGSKGATAVYASVSFDEVMFADPRYIMTSASGVADPTSFAATANGSAQIDLSWAKNGSSNNVMVACNSTNTFGTPTGPYTAGNSITDGGTVIYNGNGTTYNHTGLTPNTPYYYKAWSVDATPAYSAGVTANATTAAAAVIRYVTPTGAGSYDGTSWANAYPGTQLQTAIDETGVTQVWVKAGTYKPTTGTDRTISFRMKNGVAIYGGFAGTEDPVTFDLDNRNFENNVTILSGDLSGDDNYSTVPATNISDNCYQVVYNPEQNPVINNTAILDGVTVKGGNAHGSYPSSMGGGIYNEYSSPTFINVTVSNNSADSFAGGLCNINSSPTLQNVIISYNNGLKGGGMYNESSGTTTLINVTISNNSATDYGGGIYNSWSSLTLNNCIVWGNTSTNPGKQFFIQGTPATILNNSCYSNSTDDVLGQLAVNNSTTDNPKFIDAASGDFRLYGNSPCVNTGNNAYNSLATDIRGQARIQNTTIDMGAYEWTSGTDPDYLVVRRYVTPSGGSVTKDGTSWANAYDNTQLQTAIDETGVTDVWVAAGTYKPTLQQGGSGDRYKSFRMKNNCAIYGGFAGTETLLSQRNVATDVTILSGDLSNNDNFDVQNGGYQGTTGDDNCYHVVYNPDQTPDINSTAILDGFTLRGGNANASASPHNVGGGICNYSSLPTLTNVTVSNNFAIEMGGGIHNYSNSSPTLTNVTISNNFANSGGGISNLFSSQTLNNVTINNNSATSSGGGIYNDNSSSTLTNVTISNNSAISNSTGGGIYNNNSSTTLINVTISNNSATSGGGMNNYYSQTTLNNCIVWGNTATNFGKQIYIWGQTTTLNYSCYSYETGDVYLTNSGILAASNNNITTDPKFVDATNGDFRICGNSPCVNTGYNSYNTQSTDIRGQARIQNTTIDMGAYEWTSGTDPDYLVVRRYITQTGGSVTKDGTTWANAYDNTQLQTAIDETGVTDVWVAAGTYKPTTGTNRTISFQMKNNVAIYGGFAGTETLLSDRNVATNVTILSGDLNGNDNYNVTPWTGMDENCYHVFYLTSNISQSNSTAKLDGFTISGGNANGANPHNSGGGFYSYNCYPTLNNLKVVNNIASTAGGFYIHNNTEQLIITNTLISNNRSTTFNGNGGGLFCNVSNVSLKNVTISNNISSNNGGGVGIFNSVTNFNNCIIQGNTATTNGNEFYIFDYVTTTLNYSCYGDETGDIFLRTGAVLTATNNNITTDPKFVDAANGDFRICGNSPCMNTGYNSYNTQSTDIRGQARIQNTTIDMGAYEWSSGIDPEQAISWTGTVGTDWFTDGNWSSNLKPTASVFAIIPNTTNKPVINVVSNTALCNGMAINASSNVTIGSQGSLSVTYKLTNNAGVGGLVIKSDATGTGSLLNSTANVAATVERYIAKWTDANHGWHFLSSPVASQAISATFVNISGTISDQVDLYKWSELENLWINIKNDAGTYNVGSGSLNWSGSASPTFETAKGYMTAYGSNQTKTFTGTLNTANVPLTGLTNTAGKANRGWHLVGNPFSSAIKWNQGSWEKTNMGSVPQIWNEANASYTVLSADGIIPAQNGFMVYTTGNGSLTIPADARLHSSDAWYKNSASANEIVLVAHDPEGKTAQESIISFNANATEDFDMEHDSYFMAGFAPMFYSISQNQLFALNTLPELTSELVVPMGFVKNQSNNFTIELVQNIPGQTLYLVDLKNKNEHKILESPYSFTSADSDNPNRFLLKFGTIGIGETPVTPQINAWFNNNMLYVNNPDGITKIEVFDLSGKRLLSTQLSGLGLQSMPLHQPTGLYLIRLTSNGTTRTIKANVDIN